ncbi:MAG: SUMF1/EgtB/PvdO family nonheme iron enzyme, partial [bacterium]
KVFNNTWEIYETLIDRWIEREANKRKHKIIDRKRFKEDLHTYSRLVAIEIYRQRKQTNSLNLKRDEAIEIACENNIDLQGYEITGQSLLTRDTEGNWKFAHKSIFEFLVAREAVRNLDFLKEIDFSGMDMAQQFYQEMSEFIFIKGGIFMMGSPESEVGRKEGETLHQVKLGNFYMAKHQVTIAKFETFISESKCRTDADKDGGSYIWNGKEWIKKSGINWKCDTKGKLQKNKEHPVIHVSWNDATEYCRWLSDRSNITFRLPTEAEWEYACRAGTKTPFNTGDNLTTDQANYDGNFPYKSNPKGKYIGRTTPVGSYRPNSWGLYDMHGNIWEWCMDWHSQEYYDECKKKGIVENPEGPETGSHRVLRGGSWLADAPDCRSALRGSTDPVNRRGSIGFRLVFVP